MACDNFKFFVAFQALNTCTNGSGLSCAQGAVSP